MRKQSKGPYAGYQYWERTVFSAVTLNSGDTGIDFFSGSEPATQRNYKVNGGNFFVGNKGRVYSVQAKVFGPSFAPLRFAADATGRAAAAALNQLTQTCQVRIEQDSQPVHEGMLAPDMMAPLPIFTESADIASPTNLVRPPDGMLVPHGGGPRMSSGQLYTTFFLPPLVVPDSQAITFKASWPSGYSVPAALANYIVALYAVIEDVASRNPQDARPA